LLSGNYLPFNNSLKAAKAICGLTVHELFGISNSMIISNHSGKKITPKYYQLKNKYEKYLYK